MKLPENISWSEEELVERLRQTSVFLGKLLAVGVVFQAVIYLRPDTYFLQSQLASLSGAILAFLGVDLAIDGAYLIGTEETYFVNQDCLGWKSAFAFFGLMVASTEDIRSDLGFIIGGIITVLILNIVRVVTTIYLSHHGVISFEVIHTVLWRWGLTVIVFFLWITWLKDFHRYFWSKFIYRS